MKRHLLVAAAIVVACGIGGLAWMHSAGGGRDLRPADSEAFYFPADLAYPPDVNLNRIGMTGTQMWLHITSDAGQFLVERDTADGTAHTWKISENRDSAFSGALAVDPQRQRVWVAWRDIIGYWDAKTNQWREAKRTYPLGASVGPLGLALDPQGCAWVVWTDTDDYVFSYDGSLTEASHPVLPESIPANTVTQLLAQDDTLWVCSTTGLLGRVDLSSMTVVTIDCPAVTLAIATDGSLYGLSSRARAFVRILPEGSVHGLAVCAALPGDDFPQSLAVRPDGKVWMVGRRQVVLYDPQLESLAKLPFPIRQVEQDGQMLWAPVTFLNVAVDKDGGLWFADRCWYHCVWNVNAPK